ncbi:MAG: cupin domain-containing protein [Candidatus Methanomethylicia archaeon]
MRFIRNLKDAEIFEAPEPWRRILTILIDKNSMGAENMVVGLGRFECGQKCAPHKHDDSEEAYYILEGKGIIKINEEEYEVSKEDAIFIPKGFTHQIMNNNDKDLVFLWIMSPPGNVAETIRSFKRIK